MPPWFHRVGAAAQLQLPAIRRWRNGHTRTAAFLHRSEGWDAAEITRWQLAELNALLTHAAMHVPAYHEKFTANDTPRTPLTAIAQLRHFPFLTKDELRTRADEFVAGDVPRAHLGPITSGGTTGTPTRFMVEARTYQGTFDAWLHAMWARAGFRRSSRVLDLTWAFEHGAPLRDQGDARHLYLSINHLTPEARSPWLERVRTFAPEFLVAFPSTGAAFAKLHADVAPLTSIRALLLASETLTATQRAEINATFPNARIFSWYGMAEMAGFASGCEHSDAYHFWPQSGVLELIAEDGSPVVGAGAVGEIVLTGFSNRATPFIRYRTGDRAVWGEPCQQCGRPHPVLARLEGRLADFLLGRAGRIVPLSALNFHGDEFRSVFAHQFEQTVAGQVTLRLVRLPGFTLANAARINEIVADKLGVDFAMTLDYVDAIPRTPRGKQPLIVQRCPEAATLHL
jgi:phenylacetate-CoA ligase